MRRGFHRALDFYLDYTPAAFFGAVVANGLWWGLWEGRRPGWRSIVADTVAWGFGWPVLVPATIGSFVWSLATNETIHVGAKVYWKVKKNEKD